MALRFARISYKSSILWYYAHFILSLVETAWLTKRIVLVKYLTTKNLAVKVLVLSENGH